jgi:hypothetical protein
VKERGNSKWKIQDFKTQNSRRRDGGGGEAKERGDSKEKIEDYKAQDSRRRGGKKR